MAVDPIADDVSGRVHGVWVQVSNRSATPVARPSAWAFEWDLSSGVARRSAIVSESESWSDLGVDLSRPIPDGLSKLDLGAATASVLAKLISGGDSSVVQEVGVERRPSGLHRRIQFTAHFFVAEGELRGADPKRVVRGVSVDLGPSEDAEHADRRSASLDELVARSLADPLEYRAIADPDSLRVLYWCGAAPAEIAWRTDHIAGSKPVLHPEDVPYARQVAQTLKKSPSGTVRTVNLRFLGHNSEYATVAVTARAIDLDNNSRAILATLRSQLS